MPRLLEVSDSDDFESEHEYDSDSDAGMGFDVGVAIAAARNPVQRRRSPDAAMQLTPISPTSELYRSDPIRAEELMDGLEEVSMEWLLRYKVIQGGTDEAIICAICHESLLMREEEEEVEDVLPFKPNWFDVLVLPCKHLFHSLCLSSWLGVKSTCPSCRLDLDPESLTLTSQRTDFQGSRVQALIQLIGDTYRSSGLPVPAAGKLTNMKV